MTWLTGMGGNLPMFRKTVLGAFTALTSAAAIIQSPNWPVALLLVGFIVVTSTLIGIVAKHVEKQEAELGRVKNERNGCFDDLRNVRAAFAVFYLQAEALTGGKRRLRLAPIERLLGPDWHEAMISAENAMRDTLNEEEKKR